MPRILNTETGEWEFVPCFFCGGDSQPQSCPGDGRYHHHGMMHMPAPWEKINKAEGHVATCNDCFPRADGIWYAFRLKGKKVQVYQDPITKNDFEGDAIIVAVNYLRYSGHPYLVDCIVNFPGDGEYPRTIDVKPGGIQDAE